MDYVFRHASPDVETVLRCWRRYKRELGENIPSWREYCRNVEEKLADPDYSNGMTALLHPSAAFDPVLAWQNVRGKIVDRLMTEADRAELTRKK